MSKAKTSGSARSVAYRLTSGRQKAVVGSVREVRQWIKGRRSVTVEVVRRRHRVG